MQTDPIGYKDGMNWYAYVGNDPVNATDPAGLSGCSDASISNANTDSVAGNDMTSLESENSEKAGYFSEGKDGEIFFTEAQSESVESKGIIKTTLSIPRDASAVGHSHPKSGGEAVPGQRDDSVVNGGRLTRTEQ